MAGAKSNTGVYVALTIIILWFATLAFALQWQLEFDSPVTYLLILLLTHLYTGLFITAHDAMHGTVAKTLNSTMVLAILPRYYSALTFTEGCFQNITNIIGMWLQTKTQTTTEATSLLGI